LQQNFINTVPGNGIQTRVQNGVGRISHYFWCGRHLTGATINRSDS